MARTLKLAADPATRDWAHPLPGKVTREGADLVIDFDTPALRGKSLVVSDTLYHMFYIRSVNRENWTAAEASVEGNKVRLHADSVKDPDGVRLMWWRISPLSNVDHMPMPGFEVSCAR